MHELHKCVDNQWSPWQPEIIIVWCLNWYLVRVIPWKDTFSGVRPYKKMAFMNLHFCPIQSTIWATPIHIMV